MIDRSRWLKSLIRIALVSYAGLLLVMVLLENRMLFPAAYVASPPAPVDGAAKPWSYPSADGQTITGRLVKHHNPSCVILYLHGNGVLAAQLDDQLAELSRCFDATILAAEYSGYQNPDVTPCEANLIADSVAALDALSSHLEMDRKEIVVYGRSIGGGCASAVAAQCDTSTLVLERTFDSVADVAADKFPFLPVRLLMRNQFNSMTCLQDFGGKVIQIHGTKDTLVPLDNGQRLFECIPGDNKVFLTVPGLGHNDRLPQAILQKIAALIPKSSPPIVAASPAPREAADDTGR